MAPPPKIPIWERRMILLAQKSFANPIEKVWAKSIFIAAGLSAPGIQRIGLMVAFHGRFPFWSHPFQERSGEKDPILHHALRKEYERNVMDKKVKDNHKKNWFGLTRQKSTIHPLMQSVLFQNLGAWNSQRWHILRHWNPDWSPAAFRTYGQSPLRPQNPKWNVSGPLLQQDSNQKLLP